MKKACLSLALAGLLMAAAPAHAADPAADALKPSFDFKPVVLDSKNNDAATVAVQYALKGKLLSKNLSGDDRRNGPIDADTPIGAIDVSYEAAGTIAASAKRNPENFLDFKISLDGSYSGPWGSTSFGAVGKFETDQSFDNHQTVLGAQAAYGKYKVLARNDFFAVDLSYGRVEPGDDKDRKTALGVTKLDSYDRVDFEALYMLNTGWKVIETVELNYRLFSEVDALPAIKAADLDKHQIAGVRLGLPKDLFVAYSSGKLPFDRKNDKVLAIGFSYKLF